MPNESTSNSDSQGLKIRHEIQAHESSINQLEWSSNGEVLVSASDDGTLVLWDMVIGAPQQKFEGHTDSVIALAWSPDGKIVASGSKDTTIRLWNLQGESIGKFEGHSDHVNTLAWSPDGQILASGSSDSTIRLWDVQGQGNEIGQLEGFHPFVFGLAWSPNGKILASCSDMHHIWLWNIETKSIERMLEGHSDAVYSVAWSPDGTTLASASQDKTVRLWNTTTGQETKVFQGHTDEVNKISFSVDGQFLASKSLDKTVRLWHCSTGVAAAIIEELVSGPPYPPALSFHPKKPALATLGGKNTTIRVWDLDFSILNPSRHKLSADGTDAQDITVNSIQQLMMSNVISEGSITIGDIRQVTYSDIHYINAKVVLVGESGVGKSGLGIRIAEKEFRTTESTHGAQFWQIPVPREALPPQELVEIQAELTLWDLAGQPDYHLVHQLFLDDTDVALLLFDCSDAAEPFRGVSYWAKVLKKQSSSNVLKYLVASRCDVSPVTVDQREITRILGEYELDRYFHTCAKTGDGVEELLQQIFRNIPWNKLPRTTTPKLFEVIRKYLLERKKAGDKLIPLKDVQTQASVRRRGPLSGASQRSKRGQTELQKRSKTPNEKEINTVVQLLQSQGLIHRLNPTPNITIILLWPELINKYASSIIQAARNHSSGIGAVLERDVVCANLPFDGFAPEERLPASEEKLVLESTIELLIHHNLGFREMGQLVFPSQFNVLPQISDIEHPPTEITYEFSGSVEAIYASLVVRLSYTHDFQRENLWKYAAEFSRGDRLGFAMRQVKEGTGELEVYFYPKVNDFDRVTFTRFIRNHLYTKGIDLQERIRLYCSTCDKEVTNREAIESRIQAGKLDILCQYCDTPVLIPQSIEEKYRSDRAYHQKQKELQATVEERTKQEIQAFYRDHTEYMAASDKCIRILHLSDIHLGTAEQAQRFFTQIASDLQQNLQIKQLSYLVISGDIANRSIESEYEAAFDFVDKLVKRYGLDPSRVVIVPGNHDLNWEVSESAYAFVPQRKLPNPLPEGRYIPAGSAGALICDEIEYQKRFACFSDYFYKKIYGKPYPVSYEQQAILYPCPQDKILFLALNSAWNIDHEYRDRAGIHPNAIANALDQILTGDYDDWLKIAVWHHPVTSAESMKDVAFLEQLAVHGFQIGMHGHIHEAKDETFQYDTNRGLRIIAAGTFGASTKEQVTGIPLQYNLLTLNPGTGELTVETRKKERVDGAWSADARWGDKNNPVPRYVIPLRYSPNNAMSSTSKDLATTNNENNAPQSQQSIFNNVRVGGNLTTGNITQSYNSETRSFPAQSTQPSPSKRTILILAASPTDQGRLNLGVEMRNIDEGLRLSPQRDQFELKQSWAVRVDDLRRALLDSNPEVVHFCGHGMGMEGLAFENSVGQTQLVSTTALAGLFRLFSNHVRCVVLNACYSEVQAKAIVQHIDFVVGMKDAIGQEASTKFSIGFYDALVRGRSIGDAYEFGRNAIAEYNIPEEDIPVLSKKPS